MVCLKFQTSNRKIQVPMNALLRIHEEEMSPGGVSLTMVSFYFGQIGFLDCALSIKCWVVGIYGRMPMCNLFCSHF